MRNRLLTVLVLALGACSGSESSPGIPSDVKSIIFLQRTARNGTGNVFDYLDYVPGGRLVMLTPPSANGKLTVLTSMFKDADIMSYDLSFDAQSVVFSARLAGEPHYQLFSMRLDGTDLKQLTEGDVDYVYPIYLPEGRMGFMTNKVAELGALQFRDEYERATTSQIGLMKIDGTGEELGARNNSHNTTPALMSDGRILMSQWTHMGDVNDGRLRFLNTDMTALREAFGGENDGFTNSYLKARFVQSYTTTDGRPSMRVVAVATSRDRTLQSGKLALIDFSTSEAKATYTDLTPLVPGGREPSQGGVGRYYDAEPIGDPNNRQFLVSWADGPVETTLLAQAQTNANFGIYLLDTKSGQRSPIYDDPNMWDVLARPVRARPEPLPVTSPIEPTNASFTLSALDVRNTSLFPELHGAQIGTDIFSVRIMEGFSTEELTKTNMFGTTEFDGQSHLGTVALKADGSFAARVPANIPIHMQVLNRFGESVAHEPAWITGRAGANDTCGGCHETRDVAVQIPPGGTIATQVGPVDLDVPRAQRVSLDYSPDKVRGVPWDLAVGGFLAANCATAGCHDGQDTAFNPSCTIIDKTNNVSETFTFDLSQTLFTSAVTEMDYALEKSYVSVYSRGMTPDNVVVEYVGDCRVFGKPADARNSLLIQKLNPPQRYPNVDTSVRQFPGQPVHPVDVGGQELTPDQYNLLILNMDMGGQYYFRENGR
jgi:hypothetical protein